MLNPKIFEVIFNSYKKEFEERWDGIIIKLDAVKSFEDNWDINADNFAEMFKIATEKSSNLLNIEYKRDSIINIAEIEEVQVRKAFLELYNEENSIEDRVNLLEEIIEAIGLKNKDLRIKLSNKRIDSISTYLFLKFPNKYYRYSYDKSISIADKFQKDFSIKKYSYVESMLKSAILFDEILNELLKQEDFVESVNLRLEEHHYSDSFRIVIDDFLDYIDEFILDEEYTWYPVGYSPNITVDEWVELLKDRNVFSENALIAIKRMKEYGGKATCSQLSKTYGEGASFYNIHSTSAAKRVIKKTNCPVLDYDNKNATYWPILYTGKAVDPNNKKAGYMWKLREEISAALDRLDFKLDEYTKEDFLNEVYMSEARYNKLVMLLKNKKNIILQGAPGVGKTFTARRLAYSIMERKDKSKIEFIQFHQNYSYEDFIMGYRPNEDGFKLTKGIFYNFCKRAEENPESDYYFIIDEINRGNLSKIFGELLMLIERDYRETEMTLAYSGESFMVPENIYIIGMMNTADRSLALMDYALRRRFSFFEIEPGFDTDGFKAYQKSLNNKSFDKLISEIKILNKQIEEDTSLGKGFKIGHSYFCGKEENGVDMDWVESVIEFDLIPTLEEYWFDDDEKFKEWSSRLRKIVGN